MHESSFASRARWGVGALALATAMGAALLVAGALEAAPVAIPAGNLVKNPGFEDGPASPDATTTPPAVWQSGGTPSVWLYVTGVGYERPTKAVAAKIGGGANFLSGGVGAAGTPGTLTKTASQSIDVAGAAAEIDAGTVAANLSAYLGGYSVSEATARVDAKFVGAGGAPLGALRIGPVTREQRARQTTLLKRSATAAVPKGTRSITVVVTMFSQTTSSAVYGYADNISLVLVKATPPAAAKSTLAVACAGKTLVATVKPAKGLAVRSVTFLVNGKSVVIDKKAPFTARIATKGLKAAQLKVTARIQPATGKTVPLTKTIRHC